jgi:hypothetical protein
MQTIFLDLGLCVVNQNPKKEIEYSDLYILPLRRTARVIYVLIFFFLVLPLRPWGLESFNILAHKSEHL